MQVLSNSIQICHQLVAKALTNAQVIVDATVGNGYDLEFIIQHAPKDATIYGFDIQDEALSNTKKRLLTIDSTTNFSHKLDRVHLICDSHANMGRYLAHNIDVAIFNLGYLPKGDHAITTMTTSTLEALNYCLENLALGGHIAIVLYPGHAEGSSEKIAVLEFVQKLPVKYFTVGYYKMINHSDRAPALCWIEKVCD